MTLTGMVAADVDSIPARERNSMSIIPPDALSTIQLVSGLVASAKNAVDLGVCRE